MAVEAQKNIEENISHFMMQTISQDTVSWQLHMTTNMADNIWHHKYQFHHLKEI